MEKPIEKNTSDMADVLAGQYFLSGLDDAQHARVLAGSSTFKLRPGETLFSHGDPADYFFLVISGRLKLYRLAADGGEKIMGLVGPGATFAEGVLFMDEPCYPVNAQVLEPSRILGIGCSAYLALLKESFPTCRSVMGKLTGRIESLLDEIESLTLRDSRFRVVSFLIGLLPQNGESAATVHLPARKSEIAARVGVRPETLSRILKLLAEDGLVQVRDARHIVILDEQGLRRQLRA